MNTGDITFTATVTDSRGRIATKTTSITVTGYTLPSIGVPVAWRALNNSGTPSDEGAWVICRGLSVWTPIAGNTMTFQSRVYEKGTTPGAWVNTLSDVDKPHGGSLLHTKQYIAEIKIADLIGQAIWSVQISSSSVAIDFAQSDSIVTGVGIGEYAQNNKVSIAWPITSEGNPVLTSINMIDYVYPIGSIYIS